MHVLAVGGPGQRGTRKQVAAYGDRLICIRYRYDAEKKKRYKTAELIIEETAWTPPPPRSARAQAQGGLPRRPGGSTAAPRRHYAPGGRREGVLPRECAART